MAQDALESYVLRPDDSFAWKRVASETSGGFTVARLELTSQTWRESQWKHPMLVVVPKIVRNPDIAFLLIAGSELPESHLPTLKILAKQAGAVCAVLSEVPNQPLCDGRVEDALIAYTLDQYIRSGDETWPLLFPMVKSAVRATDALEEFSRREYKRDIKRVVLSGASKRGWTTWLTAAIDPRVVGIAPMVFDMLNMRVQTDWARKAYGHQSGKIEDYTDADLINRIDEPRAVQIREWLDPYFRRQRYTMPKLVLLGTNDPYWTVDSLRHYWNDLPAPKLVFQTPNVGHNAGSGEEAINTMAAFFETIADRKDLPKVEWKVEIDETNAKIELRADQPFKSARLWMAASNDRDFRDDHWQSHPVKRSKVANSAGVSVVIPESGYRAFLMEAEFVSPQGRRYKLSTEATVVPTGFQAS